MARSVYVCGECGALIDASSRKALRYNLTCPTRGCEGVMRPKVDDDPQPQVDTSASPAPQHKVQKFEK